MNRKLKIVWLISVIPAIVVMFHEINSDSQTGWPGVIIIACLGWVILPAILWGVRKGEYAIEEAKVGLTPLPDPVDVADHLTRQLNRVPTLEEVDAYLSILNRRKHEAQINAAVVVGGAVLLDRQAHGKDLL